MNTLERKEAFRAYREKIFGKKIYNVTKKPARAPAREPIRYQKYEPSFIKKVGNYLSSIPKATAEVLGLDDDDIKDIKRGGLSQAKISGKVIDNFLRKGTQAVLRYPTELLTEVLRKPTKKAKAVEIKNPLLKAIYGKEKLTPPSLTAEENVKQYGAGIGAGLFGIGEVMKGTGLAAIIHSVSPKIKVELPKMPEIDTLYQKPYDAGFKPIKAGTKIKTEPIIQGKGIDSAKQKLNIEVGDTIFSKKVGSRFVIDDISVEPTITNKTISFKPKIKLKSTDGKIIEISPEELSGFKKITKELALPDIPETKPVSIPKSVKMLRGAVLKTKKQPFNPTTRVNQFKGWARDLVKTIEKDPRYLEKLNEAGGGRIITNPETFKKAIDSMGDITTEINKISNWKVDKPVSTIDNAKVKIIETYLLKEMENNILNRNQIAFDIAKNDFQKIQPGAKIMGAESGRATQVLSVKVMDDVNNNLNKIEQILNDTRGDYLTAQRELTTVSNRLKRIRNITENSGVVKLIRTAENYASAAKLTSFMTHVINTVSNIGTFLQRGTEKISTSFQQLIKGRPYDALQTAKYSFGTPQGIIKASKNFFETLTSDILKSNKGEAYGKTLFTDINKKLPKSVQKTSRFFNPNRWLGAADNFWKSIIEDSYLKTRTKIESRGIPELYDKYIKNPPKKWIEAAKKEAKDFTFQADPDILLKGIIAIRNIPGGRFIVPFVQTPYNIYKFYFERSPIGILSSRNIKGIIGDNKLLESENIALREEAISRLAVGSAISYLTYELAANNIITGAYPTDPAERALWQAEGKEAWSININGHWFKYNRFQPIGLYLTQAAIIKNAIKNNDLKKVDSTALKMVTGIAAASQDMPFLSGMSSLIDVVYDPERNADKFASLIITGFIPNFLRDIRKQTDKYKRQVESIGDAIINMMPGQSKKLPLKPDILGRPTQYTQNPLARYTKVISDITETDTTRILRDARYSPLKPNTKLSLTQGAYTKEIELTGKEKEQYLKEMGEATNKAILSASSVPNFRYLDIDSKQRYLRRAIEDARSKIRSKWKIKYQHKLK